MSGIFAHGTAPAGALGLGSYTTMLIVETGAIVAGANTLVNVATVTTYAALIDNSTVWLSLTEAQREAAIIRAMQTIDSYEWRYQGYRVSSSQTLSWPRYEVYAFDYPVSSTSIPTPLKNAQAELALREAVTARATLPDIASQSGVIIEEEKRVASLLSRTKYSNSGKGATRPTYPIVLSLLEPYFSLMGASAGGYLIEH